MAHSMHGMAESIGHWCEIKFKFHMVSKNGSMCIVWLNIVACMRIQKSRTVNASMLPLLLLGESFIVFVDADVIFSFFLHCFLVPLLLLRLPLLYIFRFYAAYRVDRVLLLLLKMKRETIHTCYANCTTLYFCMLSHVWWCAWKTLVHLFCSLCVCTFFLLPLLFSTVL